jgi:hypothetical protein
VDVAGKKLYETVGVTDGNMSRGNWLTGSAQLYVIVVVPDHPAKYVINRVELIVFPPVKLAAFV